MSDGSSCVPGKNAVPLINNCSAHLYIENLSNIGLISLPLNRTSVIQFMEQGVMKKSQSSLLNTNYEVETIKTNLNQKDFILQAMKDKSPRVMLQRLKPFSTFLEGSEAYSEPSQTSKMERFANIVKTLHLRCLTGSEYASETGIKN